MKMFYQNLENKLLKHRQEWQQKSLVSSEQSQMLQESEIRVSKLDTGSLMKSSRSQRKKLSRNAD